MDKGADLPPPEAYHRVTNPERFAALHDLARDELGELTARYAVTREDTTLPDISGTGTAPAVRLIPDAARAATLTVLFTHFPGLYLDAGPTLRVAFPACGCDACGGSAEDEGPRFVQQLEVVTAGGFGDRLARDADGWWHETWRRSSGAASRQWVNGDRLAELRTQLGDGERTWAPWTLR